MKAPRRTIPHPDCSPFVNRHLGEIRIAMPVIRPDGESDLLMRAVSPATALVMASELLAGAAPFLRQTTDSGTKSEG